MLPTMERIAAKLILTFTDNLFFWGNNFLFQPSYSDKHLDRRTWRILARNRLIDKRFSLIIQQAIPFSLAETYCKLIRVECRRRSNSQNFSAIYIHHNNRTALLTQ